jgi:hypothetical protein
MPDHKGNVMNKAQLVDAIAAKADLSKAQAKVALEEIINGITQSLKEGDAVQLVGMVPSRSTIARAVPVATRKPVKRSRLQPPMCRPSWLARR